MNSHRASEKVKKAIATVEDANHTKLLVALAASYADQGAAVEKAVLAAALEMLNDVTTEVWSCIKRQLKHEEAPADALTTEEAVIANAKLYAEAILAKFPDLDPARVEKDLFAASVIVAAASRKSCFTRLEKLVAEREAEIAAQAAA
jgi:hypothetical protein